MFEKNGIFQKEINLERCDFNSDDQWNLSQILTRFQEVASDHVDSHSIGIHDLIKKDLMWVVLQTKFEICETGRPGDAVWLKTWFLPPRHKVAQREYQITDLEDHVMVKGTSRWIVMNAATRQVDSRLDEVLSGQDSCLNKNFEKRMALMRDFEAEGKEVEIIPGETAIDFNGHVNNARYLEYMCDALGNEMNCRSIVQIDYHKEMRCGEALRLFTQKNGEGIKVKGLNAEGELVFIGSAEKRLPGKEEK